MAEEKKDASMADCGGGKHGRCGGCKFLTGILVGLLISGTALGIYLAGSCHRGSMGHHMCPYAAQAEPSK